MIPEGAMKRVKDESLAHIVPLSRQSLALLDRLRRITGESEWLFPVSERERGGRAGHVGEHDHRCLRAMG